MATLEDTHGHSSKRDWPIIRRYTDEQGRTITVYAPAYTGIATPNIRIRLPLTMDNWR